MTMKIKNKMQLRDKLNHGNYERIAIWPNGEWADVGTGYAGEQDGNNPARTYSRAAFGEMTHKQITALVHSIEMMVLED